MKQLDSLTLPDGLLWSDRDQWSPVAQQRDLTLGGHLVLWSQPLVQGRPITLEARDEAAWLDSASLASLQAMAAQPGASFTLTWEAETLLVAFRHHEPPALAATPLWPGQPLYTAVIKLVQVG